jgi:glyoxylase-like metal-dependent hydrolase (beta-lactamase superfamily II)
MIEISRRTALVGAAVTAAAPLAMPGVARAAAPQIGKQAPGFYRYKVGSHEVTVVADGVTMSPRPDNYVANAPKEEVSKEVAANFLEPDKATHSYAPIVVNTGSKLVVIDTGLGPGVFEQSKGAAGQFHTNLVAAGIDRAAVDTVLISHFHGDHINGLVTGDGKPAFPNAEVMVPAAEWKFWMDDAAAGKAAGTPMAGNFTNARRVFGALGSKVTQYEGGKELVPGISSVATPGHTIGHNSFIVSSGNSKVLVQIDITAGLAFLFVRHPEWQLAFDMDKPLAVQTRRKMYDMAIAEKMPVQAFHASFPGLMHVEKSGDGYRWTPALWNTSI